MHQTAAYFLYKAVQKVRREPVLETLASLERSQWRDPDSLARAQWKKLKALVAHAYDTTPLYRQRLADVGLHPGDIQGPADFRRIPPLTKKEIQTAFHRLASTAPRTASRREATAGSTGTPLVIQVDRTSWAHQHANIFRTLSWHGIGIGEPRATIWGRRFSQRDRLVLKARDLLVNKIRLSSQEIESGAREFYGALRRHRAGHIYGYTSSIVQFAHEIHYRHGLDGSALNLKAVVCTADNLTDSQRLFLEQVFHTRVVNLYGATEAGIMGGECPYGSLHVPVESVFLELEEGEGNGRTREILVTDLNNYAMPIIRYRMGDLAQGLENGCRCGRGLPAIKGLEGRQLEPIRLPSGKMVHPTVFTYIFKELAKEGTLVGQFQFVRDSRTNFTCNICQPELSAAAKAFIRDRFYAYFDADIGLDIRTVDAIARLPSGKISYYHPKWRDV